MLVKEWVNSVKDRFRKEADQGNAGPMEAYMKGIAPFLGIKAEKRRELSKELMKSFQLKEWKEVKEAAKSLFQEKEREFHYLGQELVMKHKKLWVEDSIEIIEKLILIKSWWDTVDFLAAHCAGEYFKCFPDKKKKIVNKWIKSQDLWLNRSAILFQLKYKHQTDVNLLEKAILPHAQSKEFFHKKAIGWVLREFSKTNSGYVFKFLKNNQLKPLSVREALIYLK